MDKYQEWNEQMDNYYSNVSREQFVEDNVEAGIEMRDLNKKMRCRKARRLFCDTFGHLIVGKQLLVTKECNYCKVCGLMWKSE